MAVGGWDLAIALGVVGSGILGLVFARDINTRRAVSLGRGDDARFIERYVLLTRILAIVMLVIGVWELSAILLAR